MRYVIFFILFYIICFLTTYVRHINFSKKLSTLSIGGGPLLCCLEEIEYRLIPFKFFSYSEEEAYAEGKVNGYLLCGLGACCIIMSTPSYADTLFWIGLGVAILLMGTLTIFFSLFDSSKNVGGNFFHYKKSIEEIGNGLLAFSYLGIFILLYIKIIGRV